MLRLLVGKWVGGLNVPAHVHWLYLMRSLWVRELRMHSAVYGDWECNGGEELRCLRACSSALVPLIDLEINRQNCGLTF